MSKAIVVLLFFAVGSPSFGQNTRKPSTAVQLPVQVKVVYGDKETVFKIEATGSEGAVNFSNSMGQSGQRNLSERDVKFIRESVSRLPSISNKIEFCSNSYMQIEADKKTWLGCLDSQTKIAKEMQKLVNLLSLLF